MENIMLDEISQTHTKGHTLCDSTHVKYLDRQNPDAESRRAATGRGRGWGLAVGLAESWLERTVTAAQQCEHM